MRSKKLFIIGFLLVLNLALLMPDALAATLGDTDTELSPPVGAEVLPGGIATYNEDTDVRDSIIFSRIIPFAIRWTINFAIAIAVIALIIGGYQFLTSYGNTESQDKAKKTITYALIGLVLALTAFGIVAIISNIEFT